VLPAVPPCHAVLQCCPHAQRPRSAVVLFAVTYAGVLSRGCDALPPAGRSWLRRRPRGKGAGCVPTVGAPRRLFVGSVGGLVDGKVVMWYHRYLLHMQCALCVAGPV
jgi:hypothetical protein